MAQCVRDPNMSGKLGDVVYTPNRQGTAVRTRVTPFNPNTSVQTAVRSIFSTVTKAWKNLTVAQRLSWKNLVSAFSGNLSPFNIFTKLNATRARAAFSTDRRAKAISYQFTAFCRNPKSAGRRRFSR